MSVGIVIVTHGHVGQTLLDVAEFILGESLHNIRVVSFSQSGGHLTGSEELQNVVRHADQGDGVLVLTDLLGASPANLVSALMNEIHMSMVTGINLAMLIRVWNYRDDPLESISRKAVEGGRRGVEAVNI